MPLFATNLSPKVSITIDEILFLSIKKKYYRNKIRIIFSVALP
jgi:hypothetical protein